MKIDKYLFEDNITRLCLIDMLRRKSYLKNLKLSELESLVHDINSLMSNLQSDFERGTPVINVSDETSWDYSSLFRDIFVQNVLDMKKRENITDDADRLRDTLHKRWTSKYRES